jgi:DnaJ-class molecular chaperone
MLVFFLVHYLVLGDKEKKRNYDLFGSTDNSDNEFNHFRNTHFNFFQDNDEDITNSFKYHFEFGNNGANVINLSHFSPLIFSIFIFFCLGWVTINFN